MSTILKIALFLSTSLMLSCGMIRTTEESKPQEPLPFTFYPQLQEVLAHFDSLYAPLSIAPGHQLKLRKDPEGWHIVVLDIRSQSEEWMGTLWSKDSLDYQAFDFDKPYYGPEAISASLEVPIWDRRHYYISPYYGYQDWERDVIDEYSVIENLPDSILYAVGRAYSSFASFKARDMNSTSPDKMSDTELAEYKELFNSGLTFMEEAYKANPSMEVLVGSIHTKWSNECMVPVLDMRYMHSPSAGAAMLRDGLYSPLLRAFAYNTLISCPEDAILFTNGDNDTYPLLYLQMQEGIRPDVYVLNHSLSNVPLYLKSLREPFLDAEPIAFGLNEDFYNSPQSEMILNSKARESISLESFFNELSAPTRFYEGMDSRPIIADMNFILEENSAVQWKISDSYILRNQVSAYDIIRANFNERPVCFASTIGDEGLYGLEEYIKQRGLVTQLTEVKNKRLRRGNRNFDIDPDVMYDNVMHKFRYEGMDSLAAEGRRRLASVHVYAMQVLIDGLMEEGDSTRAHAVAMRAKDLLEEPNLAKEGVAISLAQYFLEQGDSDRGLELLVPLIDDVTSRYQRSWKGSTREQGTSDVYMIEYIQTLVMQYNIEKGNLLELFTEIRQEGRQVIPKLPKENY